MQHRRIVQLLCLALPVAPIVAALVAKAVQGSEAVVSIAAFGSFVAYAALVWLVARCPRCHASTMPHQGGVQWRVPKFCQTCNLDLTRSSSR